MSLEMLGYVILILVVLAGAALGLSNVFAKNDVASLKREIIAIRINAKQMFSTQRNYSGLNNDIAIRGGIAPKSLIKGESLQHPWGGDIRLSSNNARASFFVELSALPQEACAQLGAFQTDEWLGVTVNGSTARGDDVASVIAGCRESNTVVFEVR
jgi:hypothetical protein